ncbi:MAG: trypsin-like serine protease [Granulosicoccus sp.]
MKHLSNLHGALPVSGRSLLLGAVAAVIAGCDAGASGTSVMDQSNPVIESSESGNDLTLSPRVVNGTQVTDNSYPWMVALLDSSGSQVCGGSVIAKRWVLTAAHCVEGASASQLSTLTGRQNLLASGGEEINVSRIIIHPDYRRKEFPDIALLELKRDSSVAPVLLPSLNYSAPDTGENATVIGWGQISETGPASNALLETALVVSDHQNCATAYQRIGIEIDETAMVCAGTQRGNDSCYGDSGGPMFVKRNNAFVQAGVVSFGKECGAPDYPGVYARTASYYDWVAGYADVSPYKGSSPGGNTEPEPNQPDSNDNDGNTQPTAENADMIVDCNGLNCQFIAPVGKLDYYWDFGDGDISFEPSPSHSFLMAGEYDIYLLTIDADGGYQEHEQSIIVQDAASTPAAAEPLSLSYQGSLTRKNYQVDLPKNSESVSLPAGMLTARLSVPREREFMLFVDQLDTDFGDWYEVDQATSVDGEIVLQIPVKVGEYGFSLIALDRGGRYTLDISVQ